MKIGNIYNLKQLSLSDSLGDDLGVYVLPVFPMVCMWVIDDPVISQSRLYSADDSCTEESGIIYEAASFLNETFFPVLEVASKYCMSSLVQQLENQKISTRMQNEIKKNADSQLTIQSHTAEVLNMNKSLTLLEEYIAYQKGSLLLATFENYCGDLCMKINDLYTNLSVENVRRDEDNDTLEGLITAFKDHISISLPDLLMVKKVELINKEQMLIKKEEMVIKTEEVQINTSTMPIRSEIKNDYLLSIKNNINSHFTLISPKGDSTPENRRLLGEIGGKGPGGKSPGEYENGDITRSGVKKCGSKVPVQGGVESVMKYIPMMTSSVNSDNDSNISDYYLCLTIDINDTGHMNEHSFLSNNIHLSNNYSNYKYDSYNNKNILNKKNIKKMSDNNDKHRNPLKIIIKNITQVLFLCLKYQTLSRQVNDIRKFR